VLQKRLKIAGAWWLESNAELMLQQDRLSQWRLKQVMGWNR